MPTVHMEISSAFSGHMAISVRISATSQKYRKFVGP